MMLGEGASERARGGERRGSGRVECSCWPVYVVFSVATAINVSQGLGACQGNASRDPRAKLESRLKWVERLKGLKGS